MLKGLINKAMKKNKITTKTDAIEPCSKMTDGTIHVGTLPTGSTMFLDPDFTRGPIWKDFAIDRIADMNRDKYKGHEDWRFITRRGVGALYKNKDKGALAGLFNGLEGNLVWVASDDPTTTNAPTTFSDDFGIVGGAKDENNMVYPVRIVKQDGMKQDNI